MFHAVIAGLPRMQPIVRLALFLCAVWGGDLASADARRIGVRPESVSLSRNYEQAQLLVTAVDASGAHSEYSEDLTRKAVYSSSNAAVVAVSPDGRLLATGNGEATVAVTFEGTTQEVTVKVTGIVPEPTIDFNEQVLPVLSKAGCNGGACHASQFGKGGFTLSVMGYDPLSDRNALVRDRAGRRVNFLDPAASLALKKPTMAVPHGGGRRLSAGSVDYQILAAWIAGGAPAPRNDARRVERLIVTPAARAAEPEFEQQLQVQAVYSDGAVRDVTSWARYDSMDEAVVRVTASGLVSVLGRGQAAVMVRYEGQAAIMTAVAPYGKPALLADWRSHNFIDELAARKFRELGIEPSGLCDDATFLRRAYLDALGALPTMEEAAAFLDSPDPQKRARLVDRLLGLTGDPALDTYNDRYAAYWALKWADLIRNTSAKLGEQGMWALHNWLRESFRTNKPFDQFVRELVTAKGSIFSNGPANYFRISDGATELAENTSQLFLGVRLQCAKCHHHPFEKYSQADYYGFAAFFSRVRVKGSAEFGNFGGESVVWVSSGGEITHPRTGQVMKPTPLDAQPVDNPLDRRLALAGWLTAQDNPQFARSAVNRYMGYLLGRGLVNPLDDMRATNPPSNVPLLEALAQDFQQNKFDLKRLMQRIMHSRLYQLDSQPTPENAADSRFYSHFKVKRLAAEPLLDAIDDATGVPTKYPNLPLGTRATELPDSNYQNPFLVTFGKPKRASVCECERSPDENLAQALHTLNGEVVAAKIADGNGRVARLLAAKKPHEQIVAELYLAALSRRPTPEELAYSQTLLAEAATPQEAYQDLLWGLINSKQFLYVR